jgi:hypothetical protein
MTNQTTDESPHLNVKQLAKRWHKSPQAIYNMRHKGKAPKGFRNGRELLFPIALVEEFERAAIDADPKSNRASQREMRPAEPARPGRREPARAAA